MTLIDAVVGSALVLIIFLGLFGLIRASSLIAGISKAKAGAAAVANSQMEYLRSLDYDQIGTVGGIPSGSIAQYSTTTANGISYGVRTFVQYEDDAADGVGVADSNGITTDYKDIKVVVTYTVQGTARQESLASVVSPSGIETTTGGGTLAINVVNASGVAVPGATVRIVNASTSPTVDVTTYSDSTGVVYLGGAATSTQYRIYVSKSGYSSAQTYARDTTNQNPAPGYLTVVQNVTTTSTFAIDQLVTFVVRTYSPATGATFTDTFTDSTKLAATTSTAVAGGSLVLAGGVGTYAGSGSALSTTTTPPYLSAWTSISATLATTTNASVVVRAVDGAGVLIPDAALPGNAAGFTAFPVDLSGISTTTYPGLALRADLSSGNTSETSAVRDWTLSYQAAVAPKANVAFTLTGAKTTGSTGGGASIYKTVVATTTDSSGVRTLSLEWDLYSLDIGSLTIDDADPEAPYQLLPGTTVTATLVVH